MLTKDEIGKVCEALSVFLQEKNRRYGDSALFPIKVFHKGTAGEGIEVRLDDKLSRIKNSCVLQKNDVVDLLGYLVLKCVEKEWTDFSELLD